MSESHTCFFVRYPLCELSFNVLFLEEIITSFKIFNLIQNVKAKQKYRGTGMFETQKCGNKTSSGAIGLNIRTLASPKVGQDQVSGGVSVLCWHAALLENVHWKPLAIG